MDPFSMWIEGEWDGLERKLVHFPLNPLQSTSGMVHPNKALRGLRWKNSAPTEPISLSFFSQSPSFSSHSPQRKGLPCFSPLSPSSARPLIGHTPGPLVRWSARAGRLLPSTCFTASRSLQGGLLRLAFSGYLGVQISSKVSEVTENCNSGIERWYSNVWIFPPGCCF
uniref:Uncharacterized protein n=1 Tax=Arundo donax TaxID=35708 RepID=A0A0A9EEW9_ARUDO